MKQLLLPLQRRGGPEWGECHPLLKEQPCDLGQKASLGTGTFFFFLTTTTSKPVITSLLNFWLNPEQNGKGLYFLQGLFVNVTASFEALWKGCLYFVFVFLKSPLFVPPPPRSHTTAGHQANCLNGCLHTHKRQRTPEADYSNGFS